MLISSDAMMAESFHSTPDVQPADFPDAEQIDFRLFNNKYRGGACHVVGRGPTTFDYSELAEVNEPIFFINDAVCLEKYARSETFFFAHDVEMRPWLDGSIKSTAVLPVNGTILGNAPGVVLRHAGPLVFYTREEDDREQLLRLTRDQLADQAALFGHTGTMHSSLHFIWYCGFKRVTYIGCDGINQQHVLDSACGSRDGYDTRLANRSKTCPHWNYARIHRVQELLTGLFGIQTAHRGTPV